MAEGWIKLHRKIMEWEWWGDPLMLKVWLQLLFDANFEPKRWRGVLVDRGQLVYGREKYAKKCGISVKQLRTCMERLKTANQVAIKRASRFSLVTLIQYDVYQIADSEGASITASETSRSGPEKGHKRATPKEVKNISTIVDIGRTNSEESKRPTLEEVTAYCNERNNKVDPQKWIDHYASNGWKVGKNPMKDWQAAVRTWEKNELAGPKVQQPYIPKRDCFEQRTYDDAFFQKIANSSLKKAAES